MKIDNDVFYLLDTAEGKHLFNTEQEAIDQLKEISADNQPDPDKTMIFEVNSEGEEWNIKQVPWSKIAIGLLGGK